MRSFIRCVCAALILLAAVFSVCAFIERVDAEEVVEVIEVSEVSDKAPEADKAGRVTAEAPEAPESAEAAENEPEKTPAPQAEAPDAGAEQLLDAGFSEITPAREKTYLPIDLTAASQDAARQKAEGWSWDAEKRVLTLDGVNIETLGTSVILPEGSVTVAVKGDNRIVSRGAAKASICCFEGASKRKTALDITGGGRLSLNPSNGKGNSAGAAVDSFCAAMKGVLEINCKSYGNYTVSGIYANKDVQLSGGDIAVNYSGKAGGSFCGFNAYQGEYIQDKAASVTIKASGSRDTISGIAARAVKLKGFASIAEKSGGYITALYADDSIELAKGSKCLIRLESAKDRALGVLALDGGITAKGVLQINASGNVEAGGIYARNVRLASSTSLIVTNASAAATNTDIDGAFGIKSKTSIAAEDSILNVSAAGRGSFALAAADSIQLLSCKTELWGGDAAIYGSKADTGLKISGGSLTAGSDNKAADIKGELTLYGAQITEGGKKGRLDKDSATLVTEKSAKPVKTSKPSKTSKPKASPSPTPSATPKPPQLQFGR